MDDEPDVAHLFRQRLRREARQGTYVMHFAASGAEALDRLAEEIQSTLIAVLSDINMLGMDGLELLSEIKQRLPDLPVMMVTAYGDDDRRRRARELGAFEFHPKPVDFDQLKTQLRQLPAAILRSIHACARAKKPARATEILAQFLPCEARRGVCRHLGRENKGPDCEFPRQSPRRDAGKRGGAARENE